MPPVTKPMLMAEFDDVVTDTAVTRDRVEAFLDDPRTIGRRFLDTYPVWQTSGTTGEPGIFLHDDRSLVIGDAVGDRWTIPQLLRGEVLHGLLRQNWRIAMVAVTGGPYAAFSGLTMFRREYPFLRDRLEIVSPTDPLETLVAALNDYRPAVLVGYATVLVAFAREQEAGRLDIAPAYILPSGEPITDDEKRVLRAAFGGRVQELYAATEFFTLAGECGAGNLHANTDWFVIEPVDADYDPVAPGTPGATVLVTSLANRIFPLVRYDLGDSVTLFEEPCRCGSPFPVLEIEGRQGDVLHFEDEAGATVPVFPLAISSVVEAVDGVHRAQLVQTDPVTVTVRLDVAPGADASAVWAAVQTALDAFLTDHGITGVAVEPGDSPPERNPRSGKFRHVWAAG